MAQCVLSFRGVDMQFNEDRLVDGMAIAWHIGCGDSTAWLDFKEKWQTHTSKFGGFGIIDFPFDDWLDDDITARRFIEFLSFAIGTLEQAGDELPVDVVRAAITTPERVRNSVPVVPYVSTLQQLKGFIESGCYRPL